MATLSKTVLEQMANKMTEKSRKYADQALKEYQQLATDLYAKQVPDKVMECFKTHSDYIETAQSLYLDGHGFNRDSITMTKQLPAKTQWNQKLNLTAEIGDKLIKAKRKWEKARDEYKQLLEETEQALLTLKTHKHISENLPEAKPFLPPPMSNALVVNFDSLKKKLNKQPEIKKETEKV